MAKNDIYLVKQNTDGTWQEIPTGDNLGDSPMTYDDNFTLHINTKLRVDELEVNGLTTVKDQDVTTSEQLLITNDGTGTAVVINQIGLDGLIDIQDDGQSALFIRGDNAFGGFVGLGTKEAQEQLHITGSMLLEHQQLIMSYNDADLKTPLLGINGDNFTELSNIGSGIKFSTGDSTTSPKMTILENGDVGIGTTSPVSDLHLGSNALADKSEIRIENMGGHSLLGLARESDDIITGSNNADLVINNTAETNIIFGTDNSERVRINSVGYLGIGTSAPTEPLHIETGSDTVVKLTQVLGGSGNDQSHVAFYTKDQTSEFLMGRMGIFTDPDDSNVDEALFLNSHDTNNIAFRTGSNTRMLIQNATGNVGIGTTDPDSLLHLKHTKGAATDGFSTLKLESPDPTILLSDSTNTGDMSIMWQAAPSSTGLPNQDGGLIFYRDGDVSDVNFMINTGGNVGIGTPIADAKLSVAYSNADVSDILFQETIRVRGDWVTDGSGPAITFTNFHSSANDENPDLNDYNLAAIQACDSYGKWSGGLKFFVTPKSDEGGEVGGTSLVHAMTIDSNGNLGIGTTDPDYALHVEGGGYFAGEAIPNTAPANGIYLGESAGGPDYHVSIIAPKSKSSYIDFSTTEKDAIGRILYAHPDSSVAQGLHFFANFTGNVHGADLLLQPDGDLELASGNLMVQSGQYSQISHLSHADGAACVIGSPDSGIRLFDTTNSNEYTNTGFIDMIWQAASSASGTRGLRFTRTTPEDADFILDLDGSATFSHNLIVDGAVGIGATSPSAKLEINSGTNDSNLRLVSTDGYVDIKMSDDATTGNEIRISNKGNDLLLQRTGGNVGISTTDPREKLEIKDGRLLVTSYDHAPAGSDPAVTSAKFFSRTSTTGAGTYGAGVDIMTLGKGGHCSPAILFYDTEANGDYDTDVVNDSNWIIGADDAGVSSFKISWGGGAGTTKPQLITDADVRLNIDGPTGVATFSNNIIIPANIQHAGDTNTYFGFHANDQWRVVTSGVERLEVNDSAISLKRNTNVTGHLVVSGDLTVNGDLVTLNTTNLSIEDKVIQVAKNATTNALADESGIAFGNSAQLLYDNTTDALYVKDCAGLNGSSIKSNTITATQIAADAVGASELANNAVDTAAISNKAITAVKIADNTITATQIAANAVGSSEIAANAVGASEIAADAVGSSEIAANAVGASEIAANAVGASELNVSGNGSVGQVLKTDGDGTFSWVNQTPAYTHPSFTAGTAGSSTAIPVITVNNQGHVTSLTTQAVEIPSSSDFVQTASGAQTMQGYLQVKGQNSSAQSIIADFDIVAMANASDERLKENVVKIDSALDKVCSLEGFYFDWNNEARKFGIKLERKEVGLSAQATEKVLPEAVKTFDNSDYKYINYEKLVPVLVEAIKDLKSEIEELKKNNCGCN
jgi:hypothetical protein